MKKYIISIVSTALCLMSAYADNISVADVSISPGNPQSVSINLTNTETNLVSFQMDLTLPDGITVNKSGCSLSSRFPDDQELTIGRQSNGTIRLTSTSFNLTPISGTSGEIITLSLTTSANSEGGTATISNIRFVTSNSERITLADATFSISVASASPNITFADPAVKAICVSATTNWDTNHDGELSEAEAAAVTDLGEVFSGNTTITSFDELQYFTGLTSIGNGAFSECRSLTSIIIPNSVTSIEVSGFYGSGLTSINIPNSVTSIGEFAFQDCENLADFTIGSNVTSIGKHAFCKCSNLTSINIPNSVTSIGNHAFSGCSSLSSIIVESGNSVYDSRNNCNAIIETASNTLIVGCQNTIIPNSVTSIGYSAFNGCSNLTSVTIPGNVTSIGNYAFNGCSNLTSVTIPGSVTSIGNYAFSSCSGLTSIKVEADNTIYDSRVNCNAIIETATNTLIAGCKNTTIPESVTSIGDGAFNYCSGLTFITIPGSVTNIGYSAFNGCTGLHSITIPNSVTSIGITAFYGCRSLISVTIGCGITDINSQAFDYCQELTDVWCYAENVPNAGIWAFGSPFNNSDVGSATLHVPAASLEAYSTTAPWSGFGTIVPIEEAGIEVTDISQLDNVIYIEPFSACMGIDKNIEVRLKNAEASTGYGFDLVLPEGISIAVDDEGSFNGAVTLSPRNSGATIATHKNSDNQYTIAVMSSTSVTGNDGLVLTVKTHVQDEMPAGTYPIAVKNSKITFSNLTQLSVPDTQTSVTVRDYLIGDVNGDGETDLLDAVIVLYHSVGKPVPVFIEAAGDVNNDNEADLLDAVMILYYSVGKIPSLDGFGTKGLDPQ